MHGRQECLLTAVAGRKAAESINARRVLQGGLVVGAVCVRGERC